MSTPKRSLEEIDPDYGDVGEQQTKRQRVLELDAKQSIGKRIHTIIKKEFSAEISNKESELQQVDKRLNDARLMLDRLRACIVANYYGVANKASSSKLSTLVAPPPSIHPAVKKLIGKRPAHEVQKLSQPQDTEQKATSRETTNTLSPNGGAKSLEVNAVTSAYPNAKVPSVASPSISRTATPVGAPLMISEQQPERTFDDRRDRFKIKKKIIVGNVSKYIPVDQRESNDMSSHKWMVYVRGPKSEPAISNFVKKVWFFLHHSYKPNDLVEISSPPFHLTRRGWGEFPVRVQLHFIDSRSKKVDIIHHLKLDKTFSGLQTLGAETVVEAELERDFFEGSSVPAQSISRSSPVPRALTPVEVFSASSKNKKQSSSSSTVPESSCGALKEAVLLRNIKRDTQGSESREKDEQGVHLQEATVNKEGTENQVTSEPMEEYNVTIQHESSEGEKEDEEDAVVDVCGEGKEKKQYNFTSLQVKQEPHRSGTNSLNTASDGWKVQQILRTESPLASSVPLFCPSGPAETEESGPSLMQPETVCINKAVQSLGSSVSISTIGSSSGEEIVENRIEKSVASETSACSSSTTTTCSTLSSSVTKSIVLLNQKKGTSLLNKASPMVANPQQGQLFTVVSADKIQMLHALKNGTVPHVLKPKTNLVQQQTLTTSPVCVPVMTQVQPGNKTISPGLPRAVSLLQGQRSPSVLQKSTPSSSHMIVVQPSSKLSVEKTVSSGSQVLTSTASKDRLNISASDASILQPKLGKVIVRNPPGTASNGHLLSVAGLTKEVNPARGQSSAGVSVLNKPRQVSLLTGLVVESPPVLQPTTPTLHTTQKVNPIPPSTVNPKLLSQQTVNPNNQLVMRNGSVFMINTQGRESKHPANPTSSGIMTQGLSTEISKVVFPANSVTSSSIAPQSLQISLLNKAHVHPALLNTASLPVSAAPVNSSNVPPHTAILVQVPKTTSSTGILPVQKMSAIGITKYGKQGQFSVLPLDKEKKYVTEEDRRQNQYEVLRAWKENPELYARPKSKVGKKLLENDLLEGEVDDIPLVSLEDCPDLVSLIKAGLKRHPLIQAGINKLTHPYCAESLEQWQSWLVGKQRAAEWSRACFTLKWVKRCLGGHSYYKGEPVFTTGQLVKWCRLHALSPVPVIRSPVKKGKMNGDATLCQPPSPGRTNLAMTFTPVSEIHSMLAGLESNGCESESPELEIVEDTVRTSEHAVKQSMSAETSSTSIGPSENFVFVTDQLRKRGIRTLPGETEAVISFTAADMLVSAMTQFSSDILSEAVAVHNRAKTTSEEVTREDVYRALSELPQASFCSSKFLGKEDNEEMLGLAALPR